MFANFATAITSGTAITMALFYLMNMLIAVQPDALVDAREPNILKWVRVPPNEDPPETIRPLVVKELLEPPQPPSSSAPLDVDGYSINVSPHLVAPPASRYTGPRTLISDGPLVALVRVEPSYPARAQQSGLEGYVVVRFDVLANGTVSNVSIVESSNRMFEAAARNAARRFRFKPRVVDGVALPTAGIQNLFRFEMEH